MKVWRIALILPCKSCLNKHGGMDFLSDMPFTNLEAIDKYALDVDINQSIWNLFVMQSIYSSLGIALVAWVFLIEIDSNSIGCGVSFVKIYVNFNLNYALVLGC